MTTKRKFRSSIAEAVHEGVSGLHRLGLVDKTTMREFDVRCLTAVEPLSAKEILKIRQKAGVSQAVFARCLNVTTTYISQIERGEKHPRGATLKLLSLIQKKGLDAVL
jgi:putative transcriptional regulator